MKKNLLISSILFSTISFAQVGINNSDPKATLDVTAKTTDGSKAEGFIAPRLTGEQIKSADAQYTTDQKGAMIYATSSVITPLIGSKTENITGEGYYYFDGAKWQKVGGGSTTSSGWSLTGNAGTNPASNFLGTTDNVSLQLKSNNVSILTLDNGRVGLGLNPPDTYSTHGLQSMYDFRFGVPSTVNQHFSIAQAPSALSSPTSLKPFTLIGGNSFLGRGELLLGGHTNRPNESGVQIMRFYTATVADNAGIERMTLNEEGNLSLATTVVDVVASTSSSSTPEQRKAKLTVLGDASINGVTIGRGGGQSSENNAIGNYALFSNTTGEYNTAVGKLSLTDNTTGYANNTLGYNALRSNTTGFNNQAIGMGALGSNTTGHSNVAVGAALTANSTGNYNVGIGSGALGSSAASLNIAIGYNSQQVTTVSENVSVGAYSMLGNTTGVFNTAIGTKALYSNTTGARNSTLGNSALYTNTTGSDNTAIGYNTLKENSIGSNNTALGNFALNSNTTGNFNSAFGVESLFKNTSGINNLGIGTATLHENLTGSNNVSIGMFASYYGTGSNNTAAGYMSQLSAGTGSNNTSFGYTALRDVGNGIDNVAMGSGSLLNNKGSKNVGIGTNALAGNGGGIAYGNNNTAIGDGSMRVIGTGANNTAIGANTMGGASFSGSNNIVIGYNQNTTSITVSNQLNIGGAIFGTGLTGSATSPAGNIGIGTAAPGARLEVNNGTTAGAIKIVDGTQGVGKVLTSDASGLAKWESPSATPIRTVTASTTLAISDNGGFVYVNSAGATTVTVPSTLSPGFNCVIIQQGTGQVTLAGSGVTLTSARGIKTRTQYSAAGLVLQTATNGTIMGDAVN